MRVIGKTIKGLFYLTVILLGLGIFAGLSKKGTSVSSITPVSVETRCDHYNSQFKCETQIR